MNARIFFLVVTGLLAGGAAAQPGKTDLEKIKGTWVVTEIMKGEFAEKLLGGKFTFGDGKGSMSGPKGSRTEKFSFKLDPSKTPRELDIIPEPRDEKDATLKAIYLIEGDRLKICFAPDPGSDRKRPTTFKDDGKDQVLIGLKREKP